MAQRGNGGIIGPANVPTTLKASGLWTLEEQYLAQANNNWPNNLVQRSLRFNSADSAYLNRTPASAGNRKTWTWSAWVKRSAIGSEQAIFARSNTSGNIHTGVIFNAANKLRFFSNASVLDLETAQVFRDTSAWYHILVVLDTTQATSSNRAKIYLNGNEITAFSIASYPPLNTELEINTTNPHCLGRYGDFDLLWYLNGYMTEVNFIDGQALTPSSFGQTNANTGVWEPKPYAGTYGTNGFYLNFSDNSNTTATTLGKDYSGNGNNWTPNNFSVSAGAGNDSLVDVPTNWGVDTGVGGTVRGNYCTLNPLKIASTATLSNGNLDYLGGSGLTTSFGTIGVSSGKWYFEATPTGTDAVHAIIGVANDSASLTQYPGQNANSWGYYGADGNKYNSGSATAYGAAFGANDVIGVALDMDAGTLTYYKNGVSQGQAFSGLTGTLFPVVGEGGTPQTPAITANFGQRPFAFAAPSGFKALCTQNLPTPTVGATAATQADDYFNAVLYTGDRTDRTITVGFQPDFVWVKPRNNADSHYLMNSLSGTGKYLMSNSTAAEATNAATLTAFTSTGFSVGNTGTTNETGRTYVAWNWKANGAGVTNTAGSITSTVSANTTSGFSVVKWNGSGNATIGHGLGVAPSMYIVRLINNTSQWYVYFRALGTGKYLQLNLTAGEINDTAIWQNTAPTSTVFSIGSGINANNMIAYCFAEVPGFSKFGSYTGNGSTDGPFVYCGFRPAYVMIKCSSATSNAWVLYDNKRGAYNLNGQKLAANLAVEENNGSDLGDSSIGVDFLSNGFKIRTTGANHNTNGATYIFAAFAEFPQKFSLAR